jgi:protocatechuate 3,4-dioxygenase alpha subunit
MRQPTPPQTIGPFFGVLAPNVGTVAIAPAGSPGTRVTVTGTVVDGQGAAITDALVEIWQADAGGRWPGDGEASGVPLREGFNGFGRVATDGTGGFAIQTVKPGPVPGPDDRLQAPHLVVGLFARGVLTRLATRV